MRTWWRACRFHFVPPSYLPAVLGSVVAWAAGVPFRFGWFLLTVLGVTFNHVALNMTDDYFDFAHAADGAEGSNPYSGGSGTLTSGAIAPPAMLRAFILMYALTVAAGIYLTLVRGWPVLAFGLFGLLSAIFYTAPPVKYAYRGLGELSQLVNFSLTIGLGAFFVQAGRLSWEAALAVLPLGFMMFSMITINEIPDGAEDRRAGKRTLVVRFGARAGVWLYAAGMIAAYLTVLASPLAGLTTRWSWISLASAPLFLRALLILGRHYRDPAAMAPANLLTIQAHNLCGLLLIAGWLIRGTRAGMAVSQMGAPLAVLAVLYAPVALRVFGPALRAALSAIRPAHP